MPRRWSWYERMGRPGSGSLNKLLGELELEIMERMWQRAERGEDQATVREITTAIQEQRPVAYTKVMTVMGHLAEKGLLTRTPLDKKTHVYRVAMSKEEFLARSSQQVVDTLVQDFGDLALAQFLVAVEQANPKRIEQLRARLAELKSQSPNTGPEPEADDERV